MTSKTSRKLLVDHLRGSKSGTSEMFKTEQKSSWTLGRGNDMDIQFDPQKDDLVSRKHAALTFEGDKLFIEDLGSSNGTFVNGNKISRKTEIGLGDEVTLGENGPRITMDLDPRPAGFMKGTRLMNTPEDVGATTLIENTFDRPAKSTGTGSKEAKDSIGRETLEYELKKSKKSGRNTLMAVAGVILIIVAGALFWINSSEAETSEKLTMTPEEIAAENEDHIGIVTFGWKLVQSTTGDDVYHYYTEHNGKVYPVYMKTRSGNIEPYLLTKDYNNLSKRIALRSRGTGFLFTDDGFMMTNRHVAAGWEAPYPLEYPGILVTFDQNNQAVFSGEVTSAMVGQWVPTKASMLNRQFVETDRNITGDLLFLNVQFPDSEQPLEASLSNYSLEADVAIIKVNVPRSLGHCKLNAEDEINIGEEVVVLGYPGNSEDVYRRIENEDIVQRGSRYVRMAEPTLTNGTIAKVHETSSDDEFTGIGGNVYQLNINTTGGGNSGGPVFNEHGEVIGIYSYSSRNWNEMILTSYAVPIKYAMKAANILE